MADMKGLLFLGAFNVRTWIWGDFRIFERSTIMIVRHFLRLKVDRLKDKVIGIGVLGIGN
jgi:hypothetical protein